MASPQCGCRRYPLDAPCHRTTGFFPISWGKRGFQPLENHETRGMPQSGMGRPGQGRGPNRSHCTIASARVMMTIDGRPRGIWIHFVRRDIVFGRVVHRVLQFVHFRDWGVGAFASTSRSVTSRVKPGAPFRMGRAGIGYIWRPMGRVKR